VTVRRSPRLPPEELAPYLLEAPPPGPPGATPAPPPLDWRAVFGNDRPVEIEVGFGKGLFLLTESAAHPEVNYLGIEIERKYQLFAATRLAKRGRSNVRVVCADARVFLRDRVVSGSVRAVHVYFPDPWWKKRHHKRRVFTPEFVAEVARVLAPGGRLLAASDVPEYAAVIAELVPAHTPLRPLPPPAEHEPSHDLDYLTNYERKFRKQGKAIHRLAYERPAEGAPNSLDRRQPAG
jgi:tRNA (guanine-N7-)-methyltransferase